MSTPQMFMDAVAFVDGAADAESIVRVAVNACAGGDAHMTVVGLPRDPRHVLHLAQAPGNVLAKAVNDARDAAEAMAARLERAAAARGVACAHHTISASGVDLPEMVARIARRFDVAVMALPGQGAGNDDGALFEAALLHSGRAVIGAPRGVAAPESFERVLVAWDGHREAARAVGDALPLLKAAKFVEIFSVSSRLAPADAEIPGCHIAGHLARHGVACEFRAVEDRGPIAELLLDRAEEARADLLVMGAYRHARWRQALIGGATRTVLHDARIPLLMSR